MTASVLRRSLEHVSDGAIEPLSVRPIAKREGKLDAVQVLRAIAAAMVVVSHIISAVVKRPDLFGAVTRPRFAGGAGVDIFFLISGFIMVFASARMFGSWAGSRDFVARRLVRIAPLYWWVTAVVVALLAVKPDALPAPSAIAASFAFFPYDTLGRSDGFAFPIVDLGWTLNYEMLFYAVFALCIPLGRARGVASVAFVMVVLVLIGMIVPPDALALRFWTRPIILEFVGGMAVAQAYSKGWLTFGVPVRILLVAAAVGLYLADPFGLIGRGTTTPNGMIRVMGWGVPSALLLIAAIAGPTRFETLAGRMMLLLGDASYALYLVHPFVITVALRAAMMHAVPGPVFVVTTTVAALVAAVLVHKLVERPVTIWLTRRLVRAGAPIKDVPLPPSSLPSDGHERSRGR